jgi:CRISPR-associated exonuclease Cas4
MKNITGVMVQYYKACKTELWYFSHHIDFNECDENVRLGRIIHELFFKRQKKNLSIDNTISLDLLKKQNHLVIVEVKKSSKLPEPVKFQLLYYLWYLKNIKNIIMNGLITYPTEKKVERVVLTPELEKEIENILKDIKQIISLPQPPKPEKKKYCRKCSYFEFCWS